MQGQRVVGGNLQGFVDKLFAKSKIISENIFYSNVKKWQVATRHIVRCLEISRYRLVVFGFLRIRMTIQKPRRRKEAVQRCGLEQKTASQFNLFNKMVITTQGIPRDLLCKKKNGKIVNFSQDKCVLQYLFFWIQINQFLRQFKQV